MTASSRQSRIKAELKAHFASTLRLSTQQVETDIHLLELGVDSIMLIEAQRWLTERYGCVIEIQQFFEELNTIDRIAAHLAATPEAANEAPDTLARAEIAAITIAPEQPKRPMAATATSPKDYDLMRSQLALLSDVIEAQNRLLMSYHHSRTSTDDA